MTISLPLKLVLCHSIARFLALGSRPGKGKQYSEPRSSTWTIAEGLHSASMMFDNAIGKLKDAEYGTDEYTDLLKGLGPSLKHHYDNNDHHPEHWENGVADMSLLSIMELLADWKAAGDRVKNGSMRNSLDVNRGRFNIPDDLFVVIENTARELGWL